MNFKTSKRLDKWVENHRKQGCTSVVDKSLQIILVRRLKYGVACILLQLQWKKD